MKLFSVFFAMLFIVCFASGKESHYTASTPANETVRKFLGIPLSDSVDFIRWQLALKDNAYTLNCNYGISKPNTNGFYDGGKKIKLTGQLVHEKYLIILRGGLKQLKLVTLNEGLLHFANDDNSLMIGNGGWSYTLNNTALITSKEITTKTSATPVKDSMMFDGRTPCNVPGIIPDGKLCYKLKWRIIFYGNKEKNEPTTCKVYGTPYRQQGGKPGTWKIIKENNGRVKYEISDEKGNVYLYLVKIDENILYFTDTDGKLLVGDHDFSYSLNRIF